MKKHTDNPLPETARNPATVERSGLAEMTGSTIPLPTPLCRWVRRELWEESQNQYALQILENDNLKSENARLLEELEDWRNAAKHVDADHTDEVHCGCVPILRKQNADLKRENETLCAFINSEMRMTAGDPRIAELADILSNKQVTDCQP